MNISSNIINSLKIEISSVFELKVGDIIVVHNSVDPEVYTRVEMIDYLYGRVYFSDVVRNCYNNPCRSGIPQTEFVMFRCVHWDEFMRIGLQ